MAARQLFISALVLPTLGRLDQARAKKLTRMIAIRVCRRLLSWLSDPYRSRDDPCVVFAPHQDDETLGCGALIARKRNEGLPVHVVFITDGSASHHQHPRFSSSDIRTLRRKEALEALAILGVESTAIHFLDEADGTLNHLAEDRQARLVSRLSALLEGIRPGEIFLPCNPDGSSEHDAAFGFICAGLQAAGLRPEIWQYPVWSWWNPLLLIERMVFTQGRCMQSTEDFGPVKALALSRYRSQVEAIAPWTQPTLPPELLHAFNADAEYFFRYILPQRGAVASRTAVI
ncbi:MAG: hypothetical protein JWM35_915 [Verrucomicrobia bacterium]|nr:hypothetical protein [Verrucomicrobiota bacterium]